MAKKRRKSTASSAKSGSNVLGALWSFIAWLTGILVSLAVGFGMIDGTLSIRYIAPAVTQIAGWIVVVLALLGAILAIIDKFK
tara:strand:- start:294 stop:542 length:249 start_codon:yes stop_codon:yes gene_type:complete